MNPNERASVETEERKPLLDEVRTPPLVWTPSADVQARREEVTKPPVEAPADIPFNSSELAFACVLIPRFSDHYLVGDIVDSLHEWMKQVCVSYGWRLGGLSIRPGYMQWVMHVPLDANPARFMKLIRRHLSEKIFDDFPRFKQKNISGEFWAPGNFVVPGNQLQTPEQVNEFMLQTRRLQGIA